MKPFLLSRSISFALLLALAIMRPAAAENWPQWRGARLDGISGETNLPTTWSKTDNVAWRLPMPGPAGASPVVWNDRIFVTSADGDELVLLCVSTAGEPLWRKVVDRGDTVVRNGEGNSASPSPCTDGIHVWATMTSGAIACYTVDGDKVWSFNLQDRYGKYKIQFGMTSTPVLDNGRLYLQLIHGEGNPNTREATVVALDAASGKEIWKQGRPSDARDECEHSYASPVLYRDGEREYLLTHGADYVVAHRLEDGSEIWRCGNLNPKGDYNPTLRFVASPVAVPGTIVVPSAKRGPVFCIRPDVTGDITGREPAFFWKRPKGTPDVPSPLVYDGLVYLYDENGILTCVDAKTGEEFYQQRTSGGRHRASPVYADGKIYLAARSGVITVVRAGREFDILSQNDVGEEITASPAISDGRIYLRTFDALYAVGR